MLQLVLVVCPSFGGLRYPFSGILCDGAFPDRKFSRIHKTPLNYNLFTDGVVYWTLNRFNEGARIYFICNTPHLVKTVR